MQHIDILPDGRLLITGDARAEIIPGDEITARALLGEAAQTWIDQWTPEQIAAWAPPPPESPVLSVPATISAFQARAVLRRAGLLEQVEAAVAAHPDPEARDAWEYAIEVRRASPLVAALAVGLGLTDEQVDELFRQGAEIEA